MWRRFVLIFLVSVLLVGVAILVFIKYFGVKDSAKQSVDDQNGSAQYFPAALSSDFDPSKDEPVVSILFIRVHLWMTCKPTSTETG